LALDKAVASSTLPEKLCNRVICLIFCAIISYVYLV
jgi:hypothetical protein